MRAEFPFLYSGASLLCKCAKISSHTCTSNEIVFLRRAKVRKVWGWLSCWVEKRKMSYSPTGGSWHPCPWQDSGDVALLLLLQLLLRLIIIMNGRRRRRRRRSHFIIVITLCHNFVLLQAGPMCPRGEHNFSTRMWPLFSRGSSVTWNLQFWHLKKQARAKGADIWFPKFFIKSKLLNLSWTLVNINIQITIFLITTCSGSMLSRHSLSLCDCW